MICLWVSHPTWVKKTCNIFWPSKDILHTYVCKCMYSIWYMYVLHLRMTQKGINTIFVRLWRTDFLYQFFASSNFGVNLNRQDRTRPPVVFPREKRPSITIWLQLIMCKFEGLTCVLEKVVNSDLHGTLGSLGCFWTLLFPHSGTKKSGWQTTSPQVKMLGSPLDGLKKRAVRGARSSRNNNQGHWFFKCIQIFPVTGHVFISWLRIYLQRRKNKQGRVSHPHPHPCHHSVDMLIHSFHPWFTLYGTFLARHLWPVFPPTSITYLHLSKDSQHTSLIPRENMNKKRNLLNFPHQTPFHSQRLPPPPSLTFLCHSFEDNLTIRFQFITQQFQGPTIPCFQQNRQLSTVPTTSSWPEISHGIHQMTKDNTNENTKCRWLWDFLSYYKLWDVDKTPIINMIRFEVNDPSSNHHPLWLHGQDTVSLPANQKLCQVCALKKQSVWPNHPAWGLPFLKQTEKSPSETST